MARTVHRGFQGGTPTMKRQRRSRRIPNCVRWIASASARRATACAMDLTVGGSRGLVLSPRRKERQGWCEAVRFVHSACGMREKSSVYQADPFLKKTPASTRPATGAAPASTRPATGCRMGWTVGGGGDPAVARILGSGTAPASARPATGCRMGWTVGGGGDPAWLAGISVLDKAEKTEVAP